MERLAAAGAVNLGGLAMVEFAMGPHGYNAHLEQCRNPWNPEYIPCGSSSGSGVAVGARAVYGALGSDTGGSIRCPAAVAGVVGICPTYSRVSRYGVMPMSPSLDCVGPLARTVRDCARMLHVIAGPDGLDASASDEPVPDWEATLGDTLRGVRVGVPEGYFYDGVVDEIRTALTASLNVLGTLGADIVHVKVPPSLYEVAELQPVVMKSEGAANHSRWMRERPADYSDQVRNRLQAGFFMPATDSIQAIKARTPVLAAFVDAVFTRVDGPRRPVLPVVLQAIVSGILLGGIYSLICVGLTLTFGVMRIINFAHGEFLMVGMYATYFFAQAFHTESYAALPVVLPGLFVFGVLVYHLLVRPILGAEPLNQMLLLVGFSLVLQNAALALFSPDARSLQSAISLAKLEAGSVIVSVPKLIAFGASLVITSRPYWLLRAPGLGRPIRAAGPDRGAAAPRGS